MRAYQSGRQQPCWLAIFCVMIMFLVGQHVQVASATTADDPLTPTEEQEFLSFFLKLRVQKWPRGLPRYQWDMQELWKLTKNKPAIARLAKDKKIAVSENLAEQINNNQLLSEAIVKDPALLEKLVSDPTQGRIDEVEMSAGKAEALKTKSQSKLKTLADRLIEDPSMLDQTENFFPNKANQICRKECNDKAECENTSHADCANKCRAEDATNFSGSCDRLVTRKVASGTIVKDTWMCACYFLCPSPQLVNFI